MPRPRPQGTACRLSRRGFLVGSLAVGCSSKPAVVPGSPKNIGVVGAGIAGLAIATDLVAHGFDVTVLEAQARPGGRILTYRFKDGSYAEAGATHVVGDPDLLALCASAGVRVEPRPARRKDLASVAYVDGRRLRGEPPPSRLSPEEQSAGELALLKRYLGLATEVDPRGPWPPGALARYDALSLADLLRERGASEGYAADADLFGEGLEAVNAAFVMRDTTSILREVAQGGGGRIAGGTDELPRALAKKLGQRVIYEAFVERISQDAAGVMVQLLRPGGVRERLEFGRVVVAVPHTVAREIAFAPNLSELKQRAFVEVPSVSVTRVFAEIETPLWEARGESGEAETDLRIGKLRDETSLQTSRTHAVIGTYLSGRRAREVQKISESERVRFLLENAERVHPGIRDRFVSGKTKCWDEDIFAGGAYAYFRPGQMLELAPVLGRREGLLHFAGDHTSYRPGFMHGALASAKRVVHEIVSPL